MALKSNNSVDCCLLPAGQQQHLNLFPLEANVTNPFCYAQKSTPSRVWTSLLFLFRQFHNRFHLLHDPVVILPVVRNQTAAAVFDAIFQIGKVSAALVSQGIKRAIAEKTVKILRVDPLVAGKEFAGSVLAEFIVFHIPYTSVQGYSTGGSWVNSILFPVLGWVKASRWDHNAISQGSFNSLYFRSPTKGKPRLEN